MGTGLALLGLAALAAGAVAAWVARSRRLVRRARRGEILDGVARRVEAALSALRTVPAPTLPDPPLRATPAPAPRAGARLAGRAALIDELHRAVEGARAEGSRLAAAVIDADRAVDDVLGDALSDTAGTPVYLVGPRTAALVLPGSGRAAALGVLARIQAAHGLQGRVVELEADEDAVGLAARLLEQPRRPD